MSHFITNLVRFKLFPVRADARRVFPDRPPEPDATGAAFGSHRRSGGGVGAALDGDAERDTAEEALVHPSKRRHSFPHGFHVQLGKFEIIVTISIIIPSIGQQQQSK